MLLLSFVSLYAYEHTLPYLPFQLLPCNIDFTFHFIFLSRLLLGYNTDFTLIIQLLPVTGSSLVYFYLQLRSILLYTQRLYYIGTPNAQ